MNKCAVIATSIAMIAALGCGGGNSLFGQDGGVDATSDAINDNGNPAFPDVSGESSPSCVNLQCQVQNCGGGLHTTVSGTVYDPAGRNPLYNVYVYVPNATVEPITTGAVCEQCQAPASGSPLPGAVQTDALGHFSVSDVPVGSNIPLVMQIGKFRRQIIIPTVNACVDNPIGSKDSNNLETITRLPRTQNEGMNNIDNLPQLGMATGGCDVLECLMRKIGIADTEFTKTGRVHLFQGSGGVTGPGDSKYTNAYAFWADQADLQAHDIVVNSCECSPNDRDSMGPAYTSMHTYLDTGGRLFGTHYHYNWFAPPTGPADFQGTAKWLTNNPFANAPWYINTTIPKGVALNAWIQNIWKASPPTNGQVDLVYSNSDASQVLGKTTPWIYYGNASLSSNAYGTAYLSFDTPITVVAPAVQCGRAVFSDLHVSSGGGGGTAFPQECGAGNPYTTAMTQQETVLEFLFFDLSSCVTDDSMPPPPPPPN
jgi:hypothetical protein